MAKYATNESAKSLRSVGKVRDLMFLQESHAHETRIGSLSIFAAPIRQAVKRSKTSFCKRAVAKGKEPPNTFTFLLFDKKTQNIRQRLLAPS